MDRRDFLFKEETHRILGACFEVYNEKGCGLAEVIYHDCLEIEFDLQDIPYVSKTPVQVEYKGRLLNRHYEPDVICFDSVIVELKAVSKLMDEHRAQLINYLRLTGLKVGLLVNFGHYPKLEYERIANTQKNHPRSSA